MEATDFGQLLKSKREAKSLTMRELDKRSGVSHSYISQMERGERGIPSPDILKKLADPLDVNYFYLMNAAGYLTDDEYFDLTSKEMETGLEELDQKIQARNEKLADIAKDVFLTIYRSDSTYKGIPFMDDDRLNAANYLDFLFKDRVPTKDREGRD